MWGKVKQETKKTPCHTKDELRAKIAAFINLNKEIVGIACRIFGSSQEAVVEAKGDLLK